MPQRRILSLWFPRLAAERWMRAVPQLGHGTFAVVVESRGALLIGDLSEAAEAAGLRRGMGLSDARAICPALITRPADRPREADFLAALRRWAERFSPWVAEQGRDGLVLDVTGCAHLFGGEAAMLATIEAATANLYLTLQQGLADTLGAAWAVARFAGMSTEARHAGDAIDQEVHATRSRAQKRRWERGGAPPPVRVTCGSGCIVSPGEILARIGPLPVAALRLPPAAVETLASLGLRRIEDMAVLPRAHLARRLGPEVVTRLDQALGRLAEPVAVSRTPQVFDLRLTLPEPIGLEADVMAGVDRLLAPLCARLAAAGKGARRLRLELVRTDGGIETVETGLARPVAEAAVIRPLFLRKLAGIEAGFGFDTLRLAAIEVEPCRPHQPRCRISTGDDAARRQAGSDEFADLIGRLGGHLGLEALTRLHPADSHIPEKSATVMAAGFSEPARDWPLLPAPRPVTLFPPEPITNVDKLSPPRTFRWRRRMLRQNAAFGPERIAPEWWLDDPAWRSGARDYWRMETEDGQRLWLYRTTGKQGAPGWFVQGEFA